MRSKYYLKSILCLGYNILMIRSRIDFAKRTRAPGSIGKRNTPRIQAAVIPPQREKPATEAAGLFLATYLRRFLLSRLPLRPSRFLSGGDLPTG
jgi:hypothetical protein